MHLHTEKTKTFQFLDLIHQTKCALNFNKLLNYKPQQRSAPIRGCSSSYCGSALRSGFFPTLGHSTGQHPVEDACASENLIEIWHLHYLKLRKIKIMLKLKVFHTLLGISRKKMI